MDAVRAASQPAGPATPPQPARMTSPAEAEEYLRQRLSPAVRSGRVDTHAASRLAPEGWLLASVSADRTAQQAVLDALAKRAVANGRSR
jgi:hypothetical protein